MTTERNRRSQVDAGPAGRRATGVKQPFCSGTGNSATTSRAGSGWVSWPTHVTRWSLLTGSAEGLHTRRHGGPRRSARIQLVQLVRARVGRLHRVRLRPTALRASAALRSNELAWSPSIRFVIYRVFVSMNWLLVFRSATSAIGCPYDWSIGAWCVVRGEHRATAQGHSSRLSEIFTPVRCYTLLATTTAPCAPKPWRTFGA